MKELSMSSLRQVDTKELIRCARIEDEVASIPKNRFNLILSSPPYNLGKNYEKGKPGLREYLDKQASILKELIGTLKDTGSICWQVGNYIEKGEVYPLDIYFYDIFKSLGLKLRNRIIWHFNHGLHCTKRLSGRYETLLWFTKTDHYIFNLDPIRVPAKYPGKRYFKGKKKGKPSSNPKGKNPSDYWESFFEDEFNEGVIDIPNVKSNHPEKTIHPCQFPVELVERCILAFTHEEDWVLDPFAGVGSTAIAALRHRRKVLCVEKEEEYCQIAWNRSEQFLQGTLKLRPLGKKIYEPSGKEKVSQIPLEWKQRLL